MSEHLKRLVKVTEECRNEYDIDQDDVMEYHITKEITPELACAQACLFETMGMVRDISIYLTFAQNTKPTDFLSYFFLQVAVTEEGRKIEVENWMILMPPTIVNHTKIRIGLTACNDIDSRLER